MKLTRRNLIVFFLAIVLIALVQLLRFDLFLDIHKIENKASFEYKPGAESLLSTAEKEQFTKRKSLLVASNAQQAEIDNLKTVLGLLQLQVELWQPHGQLPDLADYDLFLVFDKAGLTGEQMDALFAQAQAGGNLLILGNGSTGPDSIMQSRPGLLGIGSFGPQVTAEGLEFNKEILAGLTGPCDLSADQLAETDLFVLSQADLQENSQILASDLAGNPLIWQLKDQGSIMVINNASFASRRLRGLITGAISLLLETVAYPVAGTAVYQIIDLDFTNDKANHYSNQHYQRSFSHYLQHVWWPDMAALMNKYNLRYTMAYLGSDSSSAGREAFASLSRSVLRSQGEISYQGLPSSYDQTAPDLWPDLAGSAEYLRQTLPNYQIRAYVQAGQDPADQLLDLFEEKLPDLRIISGSYLPGPGVLRKKELQELHISSSGTVFFPRVTDSREADGCLKFDLASVITTHGLVSHAIRADEVGSQAGQAGDWSGLEADYSKLFSYVGSAYPWLANDTISTGAAKLEQAGNLDVYYEQEAGRIRLAAGNGTEDPTLLLVTEKTVTAASGCSWQRVDSVRYLVTMEGKTAFLEVE